MPRSLRLPRRVSKSTAIKRALMKTTSAKRSPYELGKSFFEQHRGTPATEDIARNTNQLLREHFRGRKN